MEMKVVETVERVYITNADVMAYAKRGCKSCYVPGLHRYVIRDAQGEEGRKDKLCPNAWQRYLKHNMDLRHDVEQDRFYKEVRVIGSEEIKNDNRPAVGDAGSSNP